MAIVIDDLGNELGPAERIAGWRDPVAGAVLPGLRFSAASARTLSRGGKEVLLHLPMEPAGYPNVRPGPGVILRTQSDPEIVRILEEDLDSVPGAVGVNNHMGSAATADPRVMRTVARVLSGRGLFFLDSRTTDATVAERVAEESWVPAARRRVFLDDVSTEAAVRAQLAELVRRARKEGSAIAIGHPYPATLAVLERDLPGLVKEGVRVVRVTELVK
ncbi:MAG: divergent polysaccharide deacetylase family protein [Thermoanaerobaculia bacterium]